MRKYNVNLFSGRCRLAALLLPPLLLTLTACADGPAPKSVPETSQTTEPMQTEATIPPRQTPAVERREQEDVASHVRDDAPLRYVVKKGDTLWDIAGYFLDDPWYWPELWYANPDIDNPHLIYPGDVLRLVYVNGRPQLRRAKQLSPKVRTLPIQAAISTIPLDAIRQFLNGPRLVTEEELDGAPYILQFLDNHLIGGAGNKVYIRRAKQSEGEVYSVVRPGPAYRDPDSGEILGYKAIPVGTVDIREFDDISTGVLSQTFREVLAGDRLLPFEEEALASDFYPRAPEQSVDARIISVFDGVSQIGQYQIVTLNRGADNGLKRGHVLDIFQTGRKTPDPITGKRVTLPPVKAGTLMVFKVEDRVSYGLVMSAQRAIHTLDSARNPTG